MPVYHTLGRIPRKRHTAFRKPDGGLYAEQLMGNEGFTGPASLLYHIHAPTTVLSATLLKELCWKSDPDRTLRHRHFRTAKMPEGGSPTIDRTPLLFNGDVAMLFARPTVQDEHFYKNGQADEVVYVSQGSGVLETQFGDLPYRAGDYLLVHRGIIHRWRMSLRCSAA